MPAGLIDEGEDAAEAAIRELKEETGTRFADPLQAMVYKLLMLQHLASRIWQYSMQLPAINALANQS